MDFESDLISYSENYNGNSRGFVPGYRFIRRPSLGVRRGYHVDMVGYGKHFLGLPPESWELINHKFEDGILERQTLTAILVSYMEFIGTPVSRFGDNLNIDAWSTTLLPICMRFNGLTLLDVLRMNAHCLINDNTLFKIRSEYDSSSNRVCLSLCLNFELEPVNRDVKLIGYGVGVGYGSTDLISDVYHSDDNDDFPDLVDEDEREFYNERARG